MEKSKKKKKGDQQDILDVLVDSAEIQIEKLADLNKKIKKLQED